MAREKCPRPKKRKKGPSPPWHIDLVEGSYRERLDSLPAESSRDTVITHLAWVVKAYCGLHPGLVLWRNCGDRCLYQSSDKSVSIFAYLQGQLNRYFPIVSIP